MEKVQVEVVVVQEGGTKLTFSSKERKELFLAYSYFSPPQTARSWGRYIDYLYDSRCFVTALSGETVVLEKHHLFGVKNYPTLRHEVLNGVIMLKMLHRNFHRHCRGETTPKALYYYLERLKRNSKSEEIVCLTRAQAHILFLEEQMREKYAFLK